ncbi:MULTISPECIES: FtsW/RodA/SpoVE family cell cycle protein [Prochlorococcus]|uniref:Probable peptidoglycan glycosyltransferase FtsW n=1 Tax=Prochlorococcus marinus str. MIT 9116 TaxID=167544 RepID=A0A0A1ZVG2_PROMR|nr:FtsW/RodA/SpoVE family cell cycle protein [Prochlorococcus marinus]KGF91171.1 Cell division protein FtsW [Prochlorococcus marinus str. MIT 9107]KGF92531.1 Cell division protein FtsW [Prochlorococcus marinus str. MIT 9116]KGF93773.1 Cell division protein FtsW [Prochlorococcus marinus str. MIT 9123]
MEIIQERKYKRKQVASIYRKKNQSNLKESILPLPWMIWPYEAKILIILIGIWSILGIFILGSSSWWFASREMGNWAYFLNKQIIWTFPGIGLFYFVLNTNIRNLLKFSRIIFYVLFFLIFLTNITGITVNGSSRWLVIGNLLLQPSELIKPFLILESSSLFAHWNLIKNDKKLFSIISFGLLILLILQQPNLSTASLTGILIWVMGLCGGVKLISLSSFASLGFITGCISIIRNEYQRLRVTSFINPWKDQQESGFQLIQSLLAIGSGGLFGQGFGLSIQKLQYLPFMYTDFIFAIFAEEFGLLGCTLFLGFLAVFSYITLRIAIKCRNNYTKLVAIGCGVLLIGQSIMHIAVATGSMPTTGLPLPFISYGGNSLIASFFIAGMLLRCSLESTGFIGMISTRKALN